MHTTETCRGCGYAIPDDAARCPGCSRRRRTSPRAARLAVGLDLPPRSVQPVPGIAPARPDAAPDLRPRDGAPYRSLLHPARWCRAILGITSWLAAGLAVALGLRLLASVDSLGSQVSRGTLDGLDRAVGSLGWATATAGGAAVLSFVWWSARGYRNLPALGIRDRRWWSVWAVLGWVVPGPNLVVPKLIVDDLWRASSPSLAPFPGPGWHRRPVGDVVHRWWVLWLAVPAIAMFGATLLAGQVSSLDERQLLDLADLVAAVLLIAAGQAGHDLVGIVTIAQARRAEVVAADVAREIDLNEDLSTWTTLTH